MSDFRRDNYDPIEKPRRGPKKPKRLIDPDAVNAARLDFCEHCGRMDLPTQTHHVKSRGAGGGDIDRNLMSLCWWCHGKLHDGMIRRAAIQLLLDLRNALIDRRPDGQVPCPSCGRACRPWWTGQTLTCHLCGAELPRRPPDPT